MSPLPKACWTEVAADILGPFPSQEYALVITDEYSRYPFVCIMKTSTSEAIIKKLRHIFNLVGMPEILKTDNAAYFTSQKFKDFLEWNGIEHRRITPMHPQSNG